MANTCEVTDGLQLWLDTSKYASYPDTGTTWYDLTNNNYDSVLASGITYNTSDRGYFTFDGENDYVDTNQSLSSESFSVGAFFKTSSAGVKMILSKETTSGYPWNYRIWMNGGQLIADIAQGATQSSLSSPLTNYNDGQWHYVMFTRNDSTWVLYVDGAQVATKVDNFTGSITNPQELWIGRSAFTGQSPTGSYQYYGDISVVMIYNRVLTLAEISQNYNCLLLRFADPNIGSSEISAIKIGNNNVYRTYLGESLVFQNFVSQTPTPTNTQTPSKTPTQTPTPSITPSITSSPTRTPTTSSTPTSSVTQTPTFSQTPTNTPTPTPTVTNTVTPSITPSTSPTTTLNASPTPTPTKTPTPSVTPASSLLTLVYNTNLQPQQTIISVPIRDTNGSIGTIYWGDETSTSYDQFTNQFVNHTYDTHGIYTVTISGVLQTFNYSISSNTQQGKPKFTQITSFGNVSLTNLTNGFANCRNLSYIPSYPPSNTTSIDYLFYDTTLNDSKMINYYQSSTMTTLRGVFALNPNFNQDISSWNVSNITSTKELFRSATSFNQNISSWNTSSNTNMDSMFAGATSFNQNIGSWDVSKVTTFSNTFDGATSFNQDISSWNISGITSSSGLNNFMRSVTLDSTNYGNLLVSWNNNKNSYRNDLNPNFGNSQYCSNDSSSVARSGLVSYGWIITDGGSKVC